MSLLQDTGIVVTAHFRARSIHQLCDTNQQSSFSNQFISLLLFLGLHWFLPHRWFPRLFWVRSTRVTADQSGWRCRSQGLPYVCFHMSTKSSQFYLYSPKSQSLLPWKASLVLRLSGKKENNICSRCGVKQHIYKCTSFIHSKSDRCYTYIALISLLSLWHPAVLWWAVACLYFAFGPADAPALIEPIAGNQREDIITHLPFYLHAKIPVSWSLKQRFKQGESPRCAKKTPNPTAVDPSVMQSGETLSLCGVFLIALGWSAYCGCYGRNCGKWRALPRTSHHTTYTLLKFETPQLSF